MDWTQTLTFIGVNLAMLGAIATLVIWAINKIDVDVKSIATRLDGISSRMDGHAARIDQLYTMFIDLVKEKKK